MRRRRGCARDDLALAVLVADHQLAGAVDDRPALGRIRAPGGDELVVGEAGGAQVLDRRRAARQPRPKRLASALARHRPAQRGARRGAARRDW